MPKLNDTQSILLSTAAQRPDGNLYPPPATLGGDKERIGKTVAALIKGTYATEVPVTVSAQAWRTDGDDRFGAVITDTGRIAIGIEPEEAMAPTVDGGADGSAAREPAPEPADRPTKAALVLSLLQREQGATLDELVEATGWLPHTTRAALTGIRKKGHAIAKGKRGDVTYYTLAA